MTRVALITTTINTPSVLTHWANTLTRDDLIIVAGDLKSPHDSIKRLLDAIEERFEVPGVYLHPDEDLGWQSNRVIGFNSIQRRNIALLHALQTDADFMLTIDDDNAPTQDTQVSDLIEVMTEEHVATATDTQWFDPGELMKPATVHRGFPIERRRDGWVDYETEDMIDVGVAEMLVIGDPDIDAVERIVNAPVIESASSVALAPKTWAPFNTQAVMIRGDLAPLLMVWPGVGRYDDIWMSYAARCTLDSFNLGAYYGAPLVRQERNPHDLVSDLEKELYGMRHTRVLTELLRLVDFKDESNVVTRRRLIDRLTHTYAQLSLSEITPQVTREAFEAWIFDVEQIWGLA